MVLFSKVTVHYPKSMKDALKKLDDMAAGCRVIAGGTDVLGELKDDILPTEHLLNINRLEELRYIRMKNGELRIGALTTMNQILALPLTQKHASILVQASRPFGSYQIRNRATLAGNLGRASPAGDSIPALYALDSKVILASSDSEREVPVAQFFKGPRQTIMKENELIKEVRFPALKQDEEGFFIKLGLRNASPVAIASVAAYLRRAGGNGRFEEARVAFGAVAPTVIRAPATERLIVETSIDDDRLAEICKHAGEETSPITDIRGTAQYRRHLVGALLYQGLYRLIHSAS